MKEYRDFIYIRRDPDPIGTEALRPGQRKTSDLAVMRACLNEARATNLNVDSRNAVIEHVGAAVAASGRPKFTNLLRKLKPNTGLIIWSLDALGRDAEDIQRTIKQIDDRGAQLLCLEISEDDLLKIKEFMRTVEMFADLHRTTTAERSHAKGNGLGVRGGRAGRPPSLDATTQADVLDGLSKGIAISALARRYNTTRQTILRVRDKKR